MSPHSNQLAASAHRRSEDTRHRALQALRRLDGAGQAVTFVSLAQAAAVSRSWLYRQPDLRAEIDRLRTTRSTTPPPSAQRASTESMRRRLEATLDETRRLKEENRQLREQLARLYGQHRNQPRAPQP
ncbi:MAG: DUF6262 family protein [Acidimicrobiales bacterium]